MARGGARPNSGPKRTRPPVKRRLMLELDASEAAQLDALQARLGRSSAAAVIREAIGFLALDVATHTHEKP